MATAARARRRYPHPNQRGEKNPQAKLSARQVRQIRRRLERGESSWSIAKDYPVSHTTVWQIDQGNSWAYLD